MRHKPRFRRLSALFRLERLEDRTVLSTLTVTTPLDEVAGSLRDTISRAQAGDTIVFATKVHNITLQSELVINKSLDIEGPGPDQLTISGNDHSRVFDIDPHAKNVTIAGMTITHGLADKNSPDVPGLGGGILNSGDLTLSEVVVFDCRAIGDVTASPDGRPGNAAGGGVYSRGALYVSDSTFTCNEAQAAANSSGKNYPGAAFGGGLANAGAATVTNCQFASNLVEAGNACTSATSNAGNAGGGAISSLGFFGRATLNVSGSNFTNNQAIGGDDNVSTTSRATLWAAPLAASHLRTVPL